MILFTISYFKIKLEPLTIKRQKHFFICSPTLCGLAFLVSFLCMFRFWGTSHRFTCLKWSWNTWVSSSRRADTLWTFIGVEMWISAGATVTPPMWTPCPSIIPSPDVLLYTPLTACWWDRKIQSENT